MLFFQFKFAAELPRKLTPILESRNFRLNRIAVL